MAQVETVLIKAKGGTAVINKEDFNPKVHELAKAEKVAKVAQEAESEVVDHVVEADTPELNLEGMTLSELQDYAKAEGISLKKGLNVEQTIKAIVAAQEHAAS